MSLSISELCSLSTVWVTLYVLNCMLGNEIICTSVGCRNHL
ncbi:rCG52296 [Rattus norvegicus]|uniref:RCG52296 n=1 Tax=Rattus norvegicus TaxID=10116 RepID=A6K0T2_RAT|nr:rCG52296 [Rattus norvegicus]